MVDSKFFSIPFAATGDRVAIPEVTQPGGAMSYQQGFGPAYELDPATDPAARRVPRDETNEYLYQLTNSVRFLQLYGAPEWYGVDDSGNDVSYPLSARVRYDAGAGMQAWRSIVAGNTATPGSDPTKWVPDEPFSFSTLEASLAQALAGVSGQTLITPRRLASSVQRGVWNYAVAAGTATALTATLTPALTSNAAGTGVRLKIAVSNPGPATLDAGPGALPIQTRTGSALKDGDLPAETIIDLICNGASWQLTSFVASEVPKIVNGEVVLYVRTDGNDGNNGSANNAANAFKTIKAAINYGISRFTFGGFSLKIQLGNAGTYAAIGDIPTGIGSLIIAGDPANPSNFIIGGAAPVGAQAYVTVSGGSVLLTGVQITNQSTTMPSVLSRYGSSFSLTNVVFASSVVIPYHVVSSSGGSIIIGECSITGDAGMCLYAQAGSIVLGGNINVPSARSMTVAWGVASSCGTIIWGAAGIGFTGPGGSGGASTGKRYDANLNGVINTGGIGAFAFPGNVNGTSPTGGQYA